MKVAKKYKNEVELHQAYIDILLRLAGQRASSLSTSILAHSSCYGKITKEMKTEIAEHNDTTIQVISNAISKLKKEGLLIDNVLNPKLNPGKKMEIAITLLLSYENPIEASHAVN